MVFELPGRDEERWLAKSVKDNPQVKFYFVSVWNGGEDGRAMLTKFEIAGQPNVTILADPGPARRR